MPADPVTPEFLALQAAVAGRYSLVRELGRGGMGVVFLAREVALDRLVAIKLLPPALAANPSLRDRFLREARTAAQLSHPHIVPIHAVESQADLVFFVMTYVQGETLGERLRARGALPMAEALRVMQEVGWAIAHAHARGVIHRDIKPDNILLEEGSDRAVVTDFGIAAVGEGDTPAGTAVGTMHYMSPEQALGASPDVRADVYALGVTAFAALAGRRPFEGAEGRALLAAQAGSDAPAIRTLVPALAVAPAAVIDRAIARDPAVRWPTVEEFAAALQGARALEPQLPIPLRRFAHEALGFSDRTAAVVGGAASATIAAMAIDMVVRHDFLGIATTIFLIVAALGAGMALLLFGMQAIAIRQLAQSGYSREAALRAIGQLDGEMEALARTPTGRLGGLWDRPVAVNGLGVTATFLGIVGTVKSDSFLAIGFILLALIAPVVTVRRLVQLRGVRGSWWGRLLGTRVGRWLWAGATAGLGRVRQMPSSGEPTAMALGGAIHELYAALPAAEQRLLAEVPDLIERLASRALDQADPHRADAILGLETLRLDLMKLRAGQIAADSITEGIEALQQVGRKVDAVLELRD
ncbi:MAG: serine/threonine-protein kinase [Gemmatimonadota bacterium]